MADEETTAADDWQGDWEATRRRQFGYALEATPAQRVRWLEEMIAIAHRSGALPRHRG
jgi:hypothetical protein